MTTLLNRETMDTIQALNYDQFSASLGLVVIFLLLAVLIVSAVISSNEATPSLRWVRLCSGVVVSLLVNMAVILGLRLLQLIQ